MSFAKKILRKIKRLMVKVFGSKTDALYWQFRHVFDHSWPKQYISAESLKSIHREFLIAKILSCLPIESVLEFGCSSGPNLHLLAKKLPEARIYGVDISKSAINEGKKHFEKNNFKNVFLKSGGIETLKEFKDKSIDVVFTDAVLIYFGKDKIEQAIKELLRIAKKRVFFLELNQNEANSIYNDNWMHNYKLLLEKIDSAKTVSLNKLPNNMWPGNWEKNGYLIEISI